jgi:hypothetical protein
VSHTPDDHVLEPGDIDFMASKFESCILVCMAVRILSHVAVCTDVVVAVMVGGCDIAIVPLRQDAVECVQVCRSLLVPRFQRQLALRSTHPGNADKKHTICYREQSGNVRPRLFRIASTHRHLPMWCWHRTRLALLTKPYGMRVG